MSPSSGANATGAVNFTLASQDRRASWSTAATRSGRRRASRAATPRCSARKSCASASCAATSARTDRFERRRRHSLRVLPLAAPPGLRHTQQMMTGAMPMFLAMELLVSLAMAQEPTCRTASSAVEAVVTSKVRELKGHELCQFRLYDHIHDIDGDGRDDFLMVFSVEAINGSANASRQFLAVFPSGRSRHPSVVEVGRRGVRVVLSLDVDGRAVVLRTAEQKEGDAMCCPSGAGELLFRLEGGKLVAGVKAAR